jgi:hypothetical protein
MKLTLELPFTKDRTLQYLQQAQTLLDWLKTAVRHDGTQLPMPKLATPPAPLGIAANGFVRWLDDEQIPDWLPPLPKAPKNFEYLYLGIVGDEHPIFNLGTVWVTTNADTTWYETTNISQPKDENVYHHAILIPKFRPVPLISDKTPI